MSGGHVFLNMLVNPKRRSLGHTALYLSHILQNMLLLLLALLFSAHFFHQCFNVCTRVRPLGQRKSLPSSSRHSNDCQRKVVASICQSFYFNLTPSFKKTETKNSRDKQYRGGGILAQDFGVRPLVWNSFRRKMQITSVNRDGNFNSSATKRKHVELLLYVEVQTELHFATQELVWFYWRSASITMSWQTSAEGTEAESWWQPEESNRWQRKLRTATPRQRGVEAIISQRG